MRTPDAHTLRSSSEYRLTLELDFQDMVPFVMEHIRKKGLISTLFFLYNGMFLAAFALLLILSILKGGLTWRSGILQGLLGLVAGSIAVIPLHELLHGLAYRLLGARKIIFGADLTQFIFYVTADQYPVSGRQILFIAASPFVVINMTGILSCSFWFPEAWMFFGIFLLSHNIMCIGDFAIGNYILNKKRTRLYSFDDPPAKKSYFYEEVPG
jgi:hypothetical protein